MFISMSVHYNAFMEKLKHVAHFGQQADIVRKKKVDWQSIHLSTCASQQDISL